MPDVEIRPMEPPDVPAVRELYASAFHEPDPRLSQRGALERLLPARGDARTLVAVSRERVVGMGAFVVLEEDPRHAAQLAGFLRAARGARRTGRFRPDLLTVAGFELYWESWDNALVRSSLEPGPLDSCFTALAVSRPFRRMGIGTALAEARIQLATERGARACYVGCWSGGRAAHLYERLGFLPIAEWGPAYEDGNTMKLMARALVPLAEDVLP